MRALGRSSVAVVAASMVTLTFTAAAHGSPATAPGTGARPAPAAGDTPSPVYRHIADYAFSVLPCHDAGEAGVARGDWDDYLCIPRRVGLDVMSYGLYVTP
jgi:hypothetical protein